jgi:flavin-dependent dehydrogenase
VKTICSGLPPTANPEILKRIVIVRRRAIREPTSWTDILIIGGGPAGCAAAITARKAGLKVVLLEARAAPVRVPGETLHPGIESILAQLGVRDRICAAGFHRHRGIWVTWGTPRVFQSYGDDPNEPWLGFQADRAKFSTILLERARSDGVSVLQSHRAIRVLCKRGRVFGVATRDTELRASWVIDAGGGRHWLANQLGLKVERFSPPLMARFGWDMAAELALSDPSLSACFDGWDWRAPINGDRIAWCKLRFLPHVKASQITSSKKTDVESPAVNATCDVTWRRVAACAGAGYFIVGDAAVVLDPAASHGVLRAIMAGIKAAHAIIQIFRGFPESLAIRDFNSWLFDWFNHDVRGLKTLYGKHPNAVSLMPLFQQHL